MTTWMQLDAVPILVRNVYSMFFTHETYKVFNRLPTLPLPYRPLQAQDKHDFNWLLGYPLNIPNLLGGGSFLDFNTGNVDTSFFELRIPMETSIAVSDSSGRFQFYTNACRIINAQNQVMENGDSMPPSHK